MVHQSTCMVSTDSAHALDVIMVSLTESDQLKWFMHLSRQIIVGYLCSMPAMVWTNSLCRFVEDLKRSRQSQCLDVDQRD
jgi:hypothetical protein